MYVNGRIFDDDNLIYIIVGHQFIKLDARGVQQFLLLDVLGAVRIEVHFGLLIIQTREFTDKMACFCYTQAFFGK